MKVNARQLSPHSPDLLAQFCQCLESLKQSPFELPQNRFRESRPQFLEKLMRRSHEQLPRLKIRRNARDGTISALQKITHTHTESSLGCSEQVRFKRRKKVAPRALEHPLAVLGVPKPQQRSEAQSKCKVYSRFPDVRKLPAQSVLKHIERQRSLLDAEQQAAAVAAWEDDKSSDDRTWFERTFA